MSASSQEARALSCPRCGGRLSGVTASALVACAACGSPLAIHVPGEAVRESIHPAKSAAEAVAAAGTFWNRDGLPARFAQLAPEAPVLLFAAVGEAHRTSVASVTSRGVAPVAHETRDVALAAPIPGVPLEKADLPSALEAGARVPFDPAALQRSGLVFDPVKGPALLFPASRNGMSLEERLAVVYVPFWLVRKRFRRGLYEALVDAGTGRLLHARAPVARTRRLLESALLIHLLAAALALPLGGWGRIAGALAHLDEIGVILLFLIPAGLVALAAWSWNRLRFRYEIEGDASTVTFRAINKPAKTFLEKAVDRTMKVTMWILNKIV